MSLDLHLSSDTQAFIESLSNGMAQRVDSRAALHELIDIMPIEASILLIAMHPDTNEIKFEAWGSINPKDVVYMVEGVKLHIYET